MLTRLTQAFLIIGWLLIALFLLSSAANAEDGGDFPTIITQQGAFTIVETGNGNVHVCTRQGSFTICN